MHEIDMTAHNKVHQFAPDGAGPALRARRCARRYVPNSTHYHTDMHNLRREVSGI